LHPPVVISNARTAAILLGLAVCLPAASAQEPAVPPAQPRAPVAVPDWPIGARADRDVITPIELVVQDPEETQLLQDRAAARVGLIYRLDVSAPAEAARRLERAFFAAREEFRSAAVNQFGRYPVPEFAFEEERFAKFAESWLTRWNGFPASPELLKAWALGDPGRDQLVPLTEMLGHFQGERRIRESTVEPDSGLGLPDVRLVAVERPDTPLTMADVDRAAMNVPRTEFVPLAKARLDLQAQFTEADAKLGRFLAAQLQPNVIYEETLTREVRRSVVGSISSLDRYRAGQALVRKGEVVTPAVRAALDQLRAVAPEGVAVIETQPEAAPPATIVMQEPAPWYGGMGTLIAVSILVLALSILFLARRVHRTHAIVQHSTALTVMQAERESLPGENPERAQIVERALRDAAVQSLYGQRQQLAEQNRQATEKLEDLEARISRLQPQIRAKLRAYEDRIAELEGELAIVRAENREHLREQLEETRRERDEFIADIA
jgi:hypothetical protein